MRPRLAAAVTARGHAPVVGSDSLCTSPSRHLAGRLSVLCWHCLESATRFYRQGRRRTSPVGTASVWRKQMHACSKLLATTTVSPRGCASGPSRLAHARPATRVVLPFARATLMALSIASPNAPRINLRSHGKIGKGWPASLPWVMVNPRK